MTTRLTILAAFVLSTAVWASPSRCEIDEVFGGPRDGKPDASNFHIPGCKAFSGKASFCAGNAICDRGTRSQEKHQFICAGSCESLGVKELANCIIDHDRPRPLQPKPR